MRPNWNKWSIVTFERFNHSKRVRLFCQRELGRIFGPKPRRPTCFLTTITYELAGRTKFQHAFDSLPYSYVTSQNRWIRRRQCETRINKPCNIYEISDTHVGGFWVTHLITLTTPKSIRTLLGFPRHLGLRVLYPVIEHCNEDSLHLNSLNSFFQLIIWDLKK